MFAEETFTIGTGRQIEDPGRNGHHGRLVTSQRCQPRIPDALRKEPPCSILHKPHRDSSRT